MNVTTPSPFSGRHTRKWVALAIALLVLFVFFRQQVLNQFVYLSSDRYDGVIQVALLEHWFNVFRGLAQWDSPNYFFPYTKILSYNEGLFLYGLIYAIFRSWTIDAFLAGELVNITIKAIGFFGFLGAARTMLKLSFSWALLGATIFTLSNNSFLQVAHAQLLSVSFVPVAALLLYLSYHALIALRSLRFFLFGSAFVLFFSAWMLTCLYTAWFFAMFVCITLCVQWVVTGKAGRSAVIHAIWNNNLALMGIGAIAVLSLLPFASVYFAPGNVSKLRPWSEILFYTPTLFDSVNVGPSNLIFGRLVEFIRNGCLVCDIGSGEREAGISPVLFLLAAICVLGLLTRKVVAPSTGKVFIIGIAVASAILWLLSIRFGANSAWYLVYKFWPGGSGLRVVSRIFLFLAVPVTALAIWYLSQVSTWPRTVMLALCAWLVIEQVNLYSVTTLDRFQAIERTAGIPKPPAACKAFFVTDSPDTVDSDPSFTVGALYPHNVDAMLIAEFLNLPTINGFASFNPPDWNFGYPTQPDYLLRVGQYAKSHAIAGLCKLDLTTKHWDADPKFVETKEGLAYWDFASETIAPDDLTGFGPVEPFGRWSIGHEASFHYALPDEVSGEQLKIRITLVNAMVTATHSQRVIVSVNGKYRKQFVFKRASRASIDLAISDTTDRRGEIRLEFPDAIAPRELGVNADPRQLGIGVKSIEIK